MLDALDTRKRSIGTGPITFKLISRGRLKIRELERSRQDRESKEISTIVGIASVGHKRLVKTSWETPSRGTFEAPAGLPTARGGARDEGNEARNRISRSPASRRSETRREIPFSPSGARDYALNRRPSASARRSATDWLSFARWHARLMLIVVFADRRGRPSERDAKSGIDPSRKFGKNCVLERSGDNDSHSHSSGPACGSAMESVLWTDTLAPFLLYEVENFSCEQQNAWFTNKGPSRSAAATAAAAAAAAAAAVAAAASAQLCSYSQTSVTRFFRIRWPDAFSSLASTSPSSFSIFSNTILLSFAQTRADEDEVPLDPRESSYAGNSVLSTFVSYRLRRKGHTRKGEWAKPPGVHRRQLRILEQEPMGQPQAFP